MRKTLPSVLFLPPAGPSPGEAWMGEARRAACQDTIARLKASGWADPILVLAADSEDRQRLSSSGAEMLETSGGQRPFHFGEALAAVAGALPQGPLAYFGGASAPLMPTSTLARVLEDARTADGRPVVWVNNHHSTDWAVLSTTGGLAGCLGSLTTDNPLGWVLERQAGFRVMTLPPSAATQADIDTPADAIMMARHAGLGPALRSFLSQRHSSELLGKVDALRKVFQTPASTVAIIGRTSSAIWQAIERRKQVWVRLFVEERGMLASGRAERGEVRSLIGELLDDWGPARFIERLAHMADGVVWDNRVWMAGRGLWPAAAERFAADLGWVDDVQIPEMADLARAIGQSPVPILTGGHSLVSGSLMALLESLDAPGPLG